MKEAISTSNSILSDIFFFVANTKLKKDENDEKIKIIVISLTTTSFLKKIQVWFNKFHLCWQTSKACKTMKG